MEPEKADTSRYDTRLDNKYGHGRVIDIPAEVVEHPPWYNQTLTQVNDCVVRLGEDGHPHGRGGAGHPPRGWVGRSGRAAATWSELLQRRSAPAVASMARASSAIPARIAAGARPA